MGPPPPHPPHAHPPSPHTSPKGGGSRFFLPLWRESAMPGVRLISAHSRSFLDGSPLTCVVACALFSLSRGAFWMEARRLGWIHVAAVSSTELDLKFEIDRKGMRSSSKKKKKKKKEK